MKDDQIKIEKITCKEICHFARQALGQPPYQSVAPISLRRALSQEKNPYAKPEDIVLLVAFSADRCAGYHGLLPGLLQKGQALHKVHWGMAFYVLPEFRGQKIGKRLLQEIKNLKIDFIVTQITEMAEHAYRNNGYKDIGRLTFFQLRADRLDVLSRLFGSAIPRPQKTIRPTSFQSLYLKRLQQAVYRSAKSAFYRALIKHQRHLEGRFKARLIDRIDESRWGACTENSSRPTFYRGIKAVNWMLQYPWVVSKERAQNKTKNYYFSEVRDIFHYVALELYRAEDRTPAGYMVLSVSHKKETTRVKLLDYYLQNKKDARIVGYLVLKYAAKFRADRIDYPDDLARYFQSLPWTQKLIKRQSRLYLFHPSGNDSPLAASKSRILFDCCDGDTALA